MLNFYVKADRTFLRNVEKMECDNRYFGPTMAFEVAIFDMDSSVSPAHGDQVYNQMVGDALLRTDRRE